MKICSVPDALRRMAKTLSIVPLALAMISAHAYAQTAPAGVGSQAPGHIAPLALQQMAARYDAYHHIQPGASSNSGQASQGQTNTPRSFYDAVVAPAIAAAQAKSGAAGKSAVAPRPADTTSNSTAAAKIPGFVGPIFTSDISQQYNVPNTYVSLSLDINQDGLPDLVTIQWNGTLNILLNPGKGKLSGIALSSVNTSAVALGVDIPYATVVDLNNDGYPDIAAMDAANNAEIIFLNNKNGGFQNAVSIPIVFSDGATFLGGGGQTVFADVNGDKIPDMVVLTMQILAPSYTTTAIHIRVYPGKGDGTFGTPLPDQTVTFQGQLTSVWSQSLLQDINKDGSPDLMVEFSGYDSSYNSYTFIGTALNSGKGVFTGFPSIFPTTGAVVPNTEVGRGALIYGGLAVSDLNGDGNPDMLFTAQVVLQSYPYISYTVFSAFGNGDGTFQAPVTQIGNQFLDTSDGGIINYADVNGDGILDAVAYTGAGLQVFKGTGGGAFNTTPFVQLNAGQGGEQQPQPADFNGDGTVTIATVDYGAGLASFFMPVNGTYTGPAALSTPGVNPYLSSVLAVGDLNGDGAPDLVSFDVSQIVFNSTTFTSYPALVTAMNDGKGNFTYKTVLSPAAVQSANLNIPNPFVVLKDLNGDGKADLLLTTGSGTGSTPPALALLPGNGDGTFGAPINISLGKTLGCSLFNPAIGDMNGDGFPDIVLSYAGDIACTRNLVGQTTPAGIFVLLNDGKGNFTPSFTPFGFLLGNLKLTDLNGDGKLDIAVADYDLYNNFYYLYVIPGNGDGTLNLAAAVEPLENTVVSSIIPGDFDGDGKQDLTVGVGTQVDASGNAIIGTAGVYLLKGRGDFTFDAPMQYAAGVSPVDGSYIDLNGDGYPDLVMAMATSAPNTTEIYVPVSGLTYLVNHGDGSFGALQQTASPLYVEKTTPSSVYYNPGVFVSDFNGDGAPDVLLNSNSSSVYLNAGGISMALTASAASIPQDTAVTLTATLTPSLNTAGPTGTISFYNNGTLIESLPVSGTTATLSLSTLPVGTNAITATYSGDSNFNAATASTAVNVTVTPLTPDFSFGAATPLGLSLTSGQTGTVSLALSGNATFNGTVALTCSGAPSEATCTVSPASITLAGAQSSTVTVVIATTAPNNTTTAINSMPAWMKTTGGLSLAGMVFALWPGRRRKLSGLWTILLLAGLGVGSAVALTACGGSSSSTPQYKYPGTPAGTSTITLTGTSGGVTHSATFTLKIQ